MAETAAQPTGSELDRFERVYRENVGHVLAYVLRRTRPSEAQDVVADCFLVVWRRFDELPGEPLPWLYGIARKVLANQRRTTERKMALHDRLVAAEPTQATSGPELAVGPSDTIVREALNALTGAEREVLMLTAWEGLNATQGAQVAGCTPVAFRLRLHRARRKFARSFEALAPESDTGPGMSFRPEEFTS